MRLRVRVMIWPLAGLVLLGWAGCTQRSYEIDMSVDEGRARRTLTVSTSGGQEESAALSAEEKAALTAAYGTNVERDQRGRAIVTGEFVGRLPDDVGGRGEVAHWESSLGSLSVYLERFRGDVDLHGQFTDRIARVDQAVDLLQAWVDFAAVDSPDGDKLRAFVDKEFRDDVRNLALYVWLGACGESSKSPNKNEQHLLAQLIQYAIERDYIDLRDVAGWQSNTEAENLQRLHGVLSRKLEIEEVPSALPPLASEEALRRSFNEEFRRSDAYREFLAQHDLHVDDGKLPDEVLGEMIFTTLGLFQGADRLAVRLRVPHQPFATNGSWTSEGGVHWGTALTPRESLPAGPIPALHYAAWSEPHQQTQQARFGRTLLAGRALAEYVLWHNSLSDETAGQWEEFLSGLKPDEDLRAAVENYRDSVGDESRLARGCELLTAALEAPPP